MISLSMQNGQIIDPQRSLPCFGEFDVLVCGGGMAGFGAAVAAAREGCKTMLVERESCLGGLATVGLVNIPLDFAAGISKEMLARLDEVNGHWHRNSDPEKHKLILDRMVVEAGVTLLMETGQEQTGPPAGSWHPLRPVPDRWGHAGGAVRVWHIQRMPEFVHRREWLRQVHVCPDVGA